MGLERRGRVKRSHDRGNWEQEDFDACDRHAVRLACLLDGSRMSREAHVRFCERPVVQSRRPTHPQQLSSPKGLRAPTFTTLFGLLVATGMRVNEALGLDRPDVDLELGILHIRRGKFGKSRYVPVHPSTVEALKKYAETRDRLFPASLIRSFFISERRRRITGPTAEYTFAKLCQRIGLRAGAKGRGRGPRLMDMRHRFAVRTLIHWYRSGLDVERELPKLSTYLGHVHVNHTYWYVEAVPELLQLATNRLMQRELQR